MNTFASRFLNAGLLLFVSMNVLAGPYGYDLHNVLAPRSAAVAGTSIAEPLDNVSAVFGNPAAISDFRGTGFTFGATWYNPEVRIDHDGSVTGGGFSAKNGNEGYLVPQVAVSQDLRALGLPATLGAGLTVVSGIGAEFRHEPKSLGAGAELIIFGANLGLGYDLTENLAIGFAMTTTFAQLDLGLAATSAETHDISWRGSVGLTYKLPGETQLGVMYHSKLGHNFDDIIAVAPDPNGPVFYDNIKTEQPQNIGFGVSNRSLMDGNLYVAADVIWKNWSNTDLWGEVYKDQWVFSAGAELKHNAWRFRAGYGYADDPTRQIPEGKNTLAGYGAVCAVAPVSGTCDALPRRIPLVKPVIEYLQATQAEVIYQHRITAGLGYVGFLAPFLDLDVHVAWQLEGDRDYGGHTTAEVYSWHAGFALTWRF